MQPANADRGCIDRCKRKGEVAREPQKRTEAAGRALSCKRGRSTTTRPTQPHLEHLFFKARLIYVCHADNVQRPPPMLPAWRQRALRSY